MATRGHKAVNQGSHLTPRHQSLARQRQASLCRHGENRVLRCHVNKPFYRFYLNIGMFIKQDTEPASLSNRWNAFSTAVTTKSCCLDNSRMTTLRNPTLTVTINATADMSRLPAHLCSQGFWSDERSVRISEISCYRWYQDGSHTKHADRETTGLLKT